MAESEPTPQDDPAAQTTDALPFANLRGFQLLPSPTGGSDAIAADESGVADLGAELGRRAARVRDAVDTAFILANDGAIRWLGDPIAKLAKGGDLFAPQAIVLADDALSAEGREIVAARVGLWLSTHVKRLLGPLLQLEAIEEGAEPVRLLSRGLARSLGVLERETVKARVKALDQDARSTLRKHGVRFGAYYIYLPALLKPAPRALALHLWGLQAADPHAEGLVETLAPLASSGRTSLASDPAISKDGYRVAGFRLCEDRAVRVDIVERLGDIIRGALTGPASSSAASAPRKGSPGFLVSGQMTSLAGCSGEQFASILRSMGFASVEMKQSEFQAATTAASEPAAPAETVLPQQAAAQADAEPATSADHQVEPPPAPSATKDTVAAPIDSGTAAEVGGGISEAPEPGGVLGEVDESQPRPETETPSEEVAEGVIAPAADPDEIVTIWRHAPRPRPRPPRGPRQETHGVDHRAKAGGEGRRDHRDAKRPSRPGAPIVGAADANQPKREPDAQTPDANRPHSREQRQPNRFDTKPRDVRHKGSSHGNGGLRGGVPQPTQGKAPVDPNSPFAKLAELKSMLEARDKKRP